MNQKVFQLLYCSRSTLPAMAARPQLEDLLRIARCRNAQAGVTGALFWNQVFFVQVLEGTSAEVCRVFERVQPDARHAGAMVLQSGYRLERDFGNWSLAFASTSPAFHLPFYVSDSLPAHGTENAGRISAFLRDFIVRQEMWDVPERRTGVRPIAAATALVA